jgi:hypothetical protein
MARHQNEGFYIDTLLLLSDIGLFTKMEIDFTEFIEFVSNAKR